jgi:hypothetical protein
LVEGVYKKIRTFMIADLTGYIPSAHPQRKKTPKVVPVPAAANPLLHVGALAKMATPVPGTPEQNATSDAAGELRTLSPVVAELSEPTAAAGLSAGLTALESSQPAPSMAPDQWESPPTAAVTAAAKAAATENTFEASESQEPQPPLEPEFGLDDAAEANQDILSAEEEWGFDIFG